MDRRKQKRGNVVTLNLSVDFTRGISHSPAERQRILDLYLRKVEDSYKGRGGNHSYRNVNNNNHNNSLLFSRCLFDAAFSSGHEWVERVEPHPLPAPFFQPPASLSPPSSPFVAPPPPLRQPPSTILTRNIYCETARPIVPGLGTTDLGAHV